MKSKKNFKEIISGADKLFSTNDSPSDEIIDENIDKIEDMPVNINSNILSNTSSNILSNINFNILDNIKTIETTGSNATFYLSKETLDAVVLAAKAKKISRSKLVDGILKQVLMRDI